MGSGLIKSVALTLANVSDQAIEQLNKYNTRLKIVASKPAKKPADLCSKSPIVRKQGTDKSGRGRA